MIQGGDFVKGDGTGLCLKCGLGRQSLTARLRGDALFLQFPELRQTLRGCLKSYVVFFLSHLLKRTLSCCLSVYFQRLWHMM